MKPAKHKFTLFKQIAGIIPAYLHFGKLSASPQKLARKYGIDKRSRTFSPWSHVLSMMFAHLSHALSLNDVCDTLRNHSGALSTIRNATAPSRNGLSHANKVRNADMAKDLFYETLEGMTKNFPRFGRLDTSFKLPRKIKRAINIIDSTTIQLFANCMDWAKHRRRKAAAKCHLLLDAHSFLPRFAVVKTAKSSDAVMARVLCNPLKEGEIAIFDKAYVDFKHLFTLAKRGILWVTRAKSNMSFTVLKEFHPANSSIILDAEIKLDTQKSAKAYPESLRLIIADVIRDNRLVRMKFITDNFDFSASTICELYKGRWDIELFFNQLKQTLKLSDFLGYSENAVRWQVWMALLVYVILRFIAYISKWKGTFARLFTTIRGTLWDRYDLSKLPESYGTAPAQRRDRLPTKQLNLALIFH